MIKRKGLTKKQEQKIVESMKQSNLGDRDFDFPGGMTYPMQSKSESPIGRLLNPTPDSKETQKAVLEFLNKD